MSITPQEHANRIKGILRSVQPLPDAARSPIRHYHRTATDLWGTLEYVLRMSKESRRVEAVLQGHFGRLYGMALVSLIEAFERFLKEVAAECVDRLAPLVADERFNEFRIQGANLAAHFGSGSIGKALRESSTWLDCGEINARFRKVLARPSGVAEFYLFPQDRQAPLDQVWRYELVGLLWQVRHTTVHNVGVITQSDAVRLRILARAPVEAPRLLVPTRNDLRWVIAFLDDTVTNCNKRIGERLAELLTKLHAEVPHLVNPQETADGLAASFGLPLAVAGMSGTVPAE